jgi:hypothetical protein
VSELQATIKLRQADLNQAVSEWLEKRGVYATDRFSVIVRTTPGDRPFDPETTEITVTGVRLGVSA